MRSTLLLNASYEPLSVVSAQRAVTLLAREKAVSLDDSPQLIHAGSVSYAVPYVAILRENIRRKAGVRGARYSRRGVLVRDNFTCQYCFKPGNTIDHVIPQSLGGKSTFENCVTACTACNGKKASLTLEQIGWRLRTQPIAPSIYETMLNKVRGDEEAYASWATYISYYVPSLRAAQV